MVKYKITSLLLIGDGEALLKAVFPAFNGETAYFNASEIVVIFAKSQTPANLGPLIKVEVVPETE